MKNNEELEKRMYFFVPYNISDIQKGIQAGHCALEYASKYSWTDEYKDFILNHKTWIILNGGTSRSYSLSMLNGASDGGTMESLAGNLDADGIKHAFFKEPDLNYALTAVCFICDERVYDFENYPMLDENMSQDIYMDWVMNTIGGKKNLAMKKLIINKRLA